MASKIVSRLPDGFQPSFSPRAVRVIALARREAERCRHDFVGTEHVLLGLIELGEGAAFEVLGKLDLNLDNVRARIVKLAPPGAGQKAANSIPFTPAVQKVLVLAQEEARGLDHFSVGSEHVLLGLLRDGDGVAARVLKQSGVNLNRARQEIQKQLEPKRAENGGDSSNAVT